MMVSIITPARNASRLIRQTIESVLNQTYTDWEMLIGDDCSTDSTVDIVKDYSTDERIRLFVQSQRLGPAATRNHLLEQARGRFIAFLDSDDWWDPTKLEKQLHFMLQNHYAFTFTDYEVVKNNGVPTGRVLHMPQMMDYSSYLCNTAIGCLTVMIDREQTGDFRLPLLRSSHDMALWLQLMKKGFNAYSLPENLAYYRKCKTSNTSNKFKAAADVWTVYREVEHLGLWPSMMNFCGYAFHAILKRIG